MQERAYINVSGAAVNSNKTGGFLEVNAPQYTSHYKNKSRTINSPHPSMFQFKQVQNQEAHSV